MSVRLTILREMEQVAKDQHKVMQPLTDDLQLLQSGLDSLCFAIIVARLEDKLGFDPFSMSDNMEFPVTLGDFIGVYESVPIAA
jgi:acyl carrier protein